MYLCFKVPKDEITLSGSRFVCVDIPFVIPIRDLRNPGGPIEFLPDEWITGAQIGVELARDLSVLATMHKLAGQLSPQLQEVLKAPMKQAFETIELPKFATISFDKQLEKEYK